MTLLLDEKVRQFTCYWRTIHVMLGLQSRDHSKSKNRTHHCHKPLSFILELCRLVIRRPLSLLALRVVAPSADYEYLMFLGARCSCGQYLPIPAYTRTHGRTENIYSIFRDKLLLLGEHGQSPVQFWFQDFFGISLWPRDIPKSLADI